MLWRLFVVLQAVTCNQLQFDYRFASSEGLFPNLFNLCQSADVYVNATCGQQESEVYCTLTHEPPNADMQCGVCDASRQDKQHAIEMAVDQEAASWWQSPSLQYGPEFNYVTITVDLKNVFQVGYILIQSGPSPRPGNWILERSINGHEWAPWQFFAITDEECWHAFGIEPTKGRPKYDYDEQVICTSYFSGVEPLEEGEIHVSLVEGRPGANGPSQTLVDFTQARFIRLRLQRLRLLSQDQQTIYDYLQKLRLRQYFYSMRDITIGGQCPCNGHANECPINEDTMRAVFFFLCLSWVSWFLATCLYIPYILTLSPTRLVYPDDESSRVPAADYGSGSVSAVAIVCALFCDSLLLAGVYQKYKINTDVFYPWLIFYAAFILGLLAVSVLVGLWAEEGAKLFALAPAALALVYSLVYACVVRLFITGNKKENAFMVEMQRVTLEPLKKRVVDEEIE